MCRFPTGHGSVALVTAQKMGLTGPCHPSTFNDAPHLRLMQTLQMRLDSPALYKHTVPGLPSSSHPLRDLQLPDPLVTLKYDYEPAGITLVIVTQHLVQD